MARMDLDANAVSWQSNLIVTLCLNCHREITEGLASEGVSMHPQENLLKLIALMLRGSAVLFDSLATSYRRWATLLENRSARDVTRPNRINGR